VHTRDENHALTGTWVLDEAMLAVEKGYSIIEIYDVYEYLVTQYNPETGEGDVLADYINIFEN